MSQRSVRIFRPIQGVSARNSDVRERPSGGVLRLADTRTGALFRLRQVEVKWDPQAAVIWAFMRPVGRASFNPELLSDLDAAQDHVEKMFARCKHALRYLVLGSRVPRVFCFGGDLGLFVAKIRNRDREGLVNYGRACVRVLYRNFMGLNLPVVTIGLVQGDALGGGFETMLSFNVVVAERGIKCGLPETHFGLFPGMGAFSLLARRLGAARAEAMILSGKNYTSEELYEMGLVHVLADPGEGEAAVRAYIRGAERRHSGHVGMYRAARQVNPLTLDELERIVDIWVEAALELPEANLKMMQRLAMAQGRLEASDPRVAAE